MALYAMLKLHLSSAAVELSAAAIAERMLPPCGQPSSDAWHHALCNACLTCHAETAPSSAAVELSTAAIAERMLPPCGQPSSDAWHHASSNAWHHMPC